MTTSVVATGYGGPENLSLVESPTPDPGPGEVRVSVRAAGVNPIDYKLYSGMIGADPGQLPMRQGLEAAGIVAAVGAGTRWAVGDEVIAYPTEGAYTTDLVTAADSLVAKPGAMSFEQAAGLLLTGATAVHVLDTIAAGDGDTVLLHGGAGGVGLMAVQLARLRGATVIATASERNHQLLREVGATPVSYGEGLAERVRAAAPQGVTAAADLVGTDEAVQVSLDLVADRARITTIANYAGAQSAGISLITGMGEDGMRVRAAARAQLVELAAAGKLRVLVAATYPLAEAAEAHRAIAAGHTVGKIVLVP